MLRSHVDRSPVALLLFAFSCHASALCDLKLYTFLFTPLACTSLRHRLMAKSRNSSAEIDFSSVNLAPSILDFGEPVVDSQVFMDVIAASGPCATPITDPATPRKGWCNGNANSQRVCGAFAHQWDCSRPTLLHAAYQQLPLCACERIRLELCP